MNDRPLLVEPALELHVDDPALAQEPALGMKKRAIDDAQVFDKQTAHGATGTKRLSKPAF